jgi:anhydro-N-acetylmuramic acid kinase
MLSIGLMSGTSMDGIDVALLETDGSPHHIQDRGSLFLPYHPSFHLTLKVAEYAMKTCEGNMDEAKRYFKQAFIDYFEKVLKLSKSTIEDHFPNLSLYINSPNPTVSLKNVIAYSTERHAIAVEKLLEKTGYTARDIAVVGYHGQTLFHRPSLKRSIIIGNGQDLANQLGITVVTDFRSRDIAEGGEGAPLAPLYHHALAVRDKKIPAAVVNCGGIANVTIMTSTNELELIGFDTGPGNGLIDRLIKQRTQGAEQMDKDGQYGKQGKIDQNVLELLYKKALTPNPSSLTQNYFEKMPPKSLDIGDMTLIPELDALSLEDACATLEAFTADSIISSVESLPIKLPHYWILAGGGWKNPVIRREFDGRLRQKLGNSVQIVTADEASWNSQAMEAQIFAYLAVRSLQNKPLSVPGTTGVRMPVSGGRGFTPTETG